MTDTLSDTLNTVVTKVQDAVTKLTEVADDVAENSDALATHNSSEDAHPYLLEKLNALSGVSSTDIASAISSHNTSNSSHSDIRGSLATLNNELGVISTNMDIVNENKDYIEQLGDLFGDTSSGSSLPAISSLNERLIVTENTVNTINTDLNALEDNVTSLNESQLIQDTRIDNLETNVLVLSSEIGDIQSNIADLNINISMLYIKGALDLTNLTTTIPTTVKAGSTYNVTFTGVTIPEGDTLTYAITTVPTGLSFSKTTAITQNENLTMTVASNATGGAILSIVVKATLSTGDELSRAFSTTVSDIPNMGSLVVSGIPSTVISGTTYNFTFTAATSTDPVTYTIPTHTNCTCTIDSANLSGTMTVANSLADGSTVSFVIRATSDIGYAEKTVTSHTASDLIDAFTSTIPAIVKPNTSYTITLNGITSSNGTVTYSIAADTGSVVTFSPNTNIAAGSSITMIVPSNAARGSTQSIIVTAVDAVNATLTKTVTTKINSLPVATGITTTLSSSLNGGTTQAFSISGGTDADSGQSVTYRIVSGYNANLTFSKTTAIASGESITLTPAYVSTATQYTFDIQAIDSLNETSVSNKTITITIQPVYQVDTPTINSPTANQVMPSDAVTFTFSSYTESIKTS